MAVKKSKLDALAKRFGITAREVRDIATALGTVADVRTGTTKVGPKATSKIYKNVTKQIKEAGTAATKGKKGTTSAQYKSGPLSGDFKVKSSKKRK